MLEPSAGFILKHEKIATMIYGYQQIKTVFSVTSPYGMGYYLNSTEYFYGKLSDDDKAAIREVVWESPQRRSK